MNNQITNIERLALSEKKVFTIEDLAVLWQIFDRRRLIERIKYYIRSKRLIHIYKGVYAFGEGYTSLDIAQKLVPLSYISLYTTSQMHGLTFQYDSTTYGIALQSKKYTINEQNYVYHRVKEPVFYNPLGLVNNGRYIIADKERTICDCLYVFPHFAFDTIGTIDKEKLQSLATMYQNIRLEKEVGKMLENLD